MTFPNHPAADQFEMLSDDALQSLADDIAAEGLRDPIVISNGQVVDGRNRVAACAIAGVDPVYTELPEDVDPWNYALSRNVERRDLTHGQKAVARARNLHRQGKRVGGRWERGSVDIGSSANNATWQGHMKRAGYVLDIAERAAAMQPAPGVDQDGLDHYASLLDQVMNRTITLDAAYKAAQQFDTAAAMADLALYRPLAEWIGHHEELSGEAIDRYGTGPEMDVPLKREHIEKLTEIVRRYREAANAVRDYLKESK